MRIQYWNLYCLYFNVFIFWRFLMVNGETFQISYYAKKHGKFITRNGKWNDKCKYWFSLAFFGVMFKNIGFPMPFLDLCWKILVFLEVFCFFDRNTLVFLSFFCFLLQKHWFSLGFWLFSCHNRKDIRSTGEVLYWFLIKI